MPQQFVQVQNPGPDFSTVMQGLQQNLARRAQLQDRKAQQAATYEQMIARGDLKLPKGANIKVTDNGVAFGDSEAVDENGKPLISQQQAYEAWQKAQGAETEDLSHTGKGTTVTSKLLKSGEDLVNETAGALVNQSLRSSNMDLRQIALANAIKLQLENQDTVTQEVPLPNPNVGQQPSNLVMQNSQNPAAVPPQNPGLATGPDGKPADPNTPITPNSAAGAAIVQQLSETTGMGAKMRQSQGQKQSQSFGQGQSASMRATAEFSDELVTPEIKATDRIETNVNVDNSYKDEIRESYGSLRRAALMEQVNNMFGQGQANVYGQSWRDRKEQLDSYNREYLPKQGNTQKIEGGLQEAKLTGGKLSVKTADARAGSSYTNISNNSASNSTGAVSTTNGPQKDSTTQLEFIGDDGNKQRVTSPDGGANVDIRSSYVYVKGPKGVDNRKFWANSGQAIQMLEKRKADFIGVRGRDNIYAKARWVSATQGGEGNYLLLDEKGRTLGGIRKQNGADGSVSFGMFHNPDLLPGGIDTQFVSMTTGVNLANAMTTAPGR